LGWISAENAPAASVVAEAIEEPAPFLMSIVVPAAAPDAVPESETP
jgi:hypothetical protein